jgi:hypothetical protein
MQKAAGLLEKREVIEIWQETNQYMLKPGAVGGISVR